MALIYLTQAVREAHSNGRPKRQFQGLKFAEHAFGWGTTAPDIAPRYWWVPIGVPTIGEKFSRSVFYLLPHRSYQFAAADRPGGTGFFVGIAAGHDSYPLSHIYAVSNRHVVTNNPCIQVNKIGGGTRKINEMEFDDWVESVDEDLAVADVTDYLQWDENTLRWLDEFSWVSEHSFVWPEWAEAYLGHDTFMIGLFDNHRVKSRNIPVARFGNIAAVPNEAAPVRLSKDDQYCRPAYLNDMRSRTGFSGSPVWVWTAATVLNDPVKDRHTEQSIAFVKPFMSFLGIHRGQMPEEIEIEHSGSGHGKSTRLIIPSAMTVVIPSWKIMDLIGAEELVSRRKQRDEREDRVRLVERLHKMIRARERIPLHFTDP